MMVKQKQSIKLNATGKSCERTGVKNLSLFRIMGHNTKEEGTASGGGESPVTTGIQE